jgi:hypothetical protein
MNKVSNIETASIEYTGVDLKVDYVFEGVDREIRILLINNAPDYFFDKKTLADIEYVLSEHLISEGIENREYLAEMRSDESRHN